MGAIDRRKHDIDVMERVLGTARESLDEPDTEIVDVGIRPWLVGTTTSTVQLRVGAHADENEPEPSRPDEDDRYESDRRGEHSYPHDAEHRAPRSHRERDELRSRLERRG